MQNKVRLNFTHKSNIKCVLDILFFIFAGTIICAFAYIEKSSLLTLLLILSVFIILYTIQYLMTTWWINKSISSILREQLVSTSDKTNSIVKSISLQKDSVNQQLTEVSNKILIIENLEKNSTKIKETIKTITNKIQQTLEEAIKEKTNINTATDKIGSLKQKLQVVAEMTLDLSGTLQQIKNSLIIVEDISEQTNMLALNAEVEAARAGEYGKGFAIVASEIRKLSEDSREMTVKISNMLTEIQNSTSSSVLSTEDGKKEIDAVVKSSLEVIKINENINQLIKDISQPLEQINLYTDNQNNYSSQICLSLLNISTWLKTFSNNINENVVELNSLSSISTDLKENLFNE